MSDAFRVEVRSVDGGPTALGWAGRDADDPGGA